MLNSMICQYEHFLSDWYQNWATRMCMEQTDVDVNRPDRFIHRKPWEFCSIAQALFERKMLQTGRKGCCFAAGQELLPSLFASLGVSVLATDLATDEAGWATTNEHATNREALYHPAIISRSQFESNVSFEPADMRNLSSLDGRSFDFVWSSCAFEHLGSIEAGLDFVMNAMKLVKPGGYAVHTTEFNVSSNDETLTSGPGVIYRKRDIEQLGYRLRRERCALEPVNFDPGNHRYDIEFDFHPWMENGRKHVKLLQGDFIATSILLIIKKPVG